ncbi:sugar transferase [Williamwhitmania taraxaci]|nr:sugar transferase [Williamwhitmania taraxaci]
MAPLFYYLSTYFFQLFFFFLCWQLIAIITGKFNIGRHKTVFNALTVVLISNALALLLFVVIKNLLPPLSFSRIVLFTLSGLATLAELILFGLAEIVYHKEEIPGVDVDVQEEFISKYRFDHAAILDRLNVKELAKHHRTTKISHEIEEEVGTAACNFISQYVDIKEGTTAIVSTTTRFNVEHLPEKKYAGIVNLKKTNDIRYINKFFESVNAKLCHDGMFVGCVETMELRKMRILKKFVWGVSHVYFFFDFILKRLFPKFPITKQLYFFLTRGQNRVLSKAETLGRLYSCGFYVISEGEMDGYYWFAVAKNSKPAFDSNPTYGPLIRLKRIGKGGKIIKVYKMRTMHPYAEYLQEYIYETNKLDEGGKFKNDFRVSALGKFMRKYWIDELPMIINLLRGDLKIVGIRPLSKHYYSLYTKELQENRIKTKPGLVPPFYADLPNSLEEIMDSESRYLAAYNIAPFKTDVRYFIKAFKNIVFKRALSK